MTIAYQDHYNAALNPVPSQDLKHNLLEELRRFLKLSTPDDALYRLCKKAPDTILEDWQSRRIDPSDDRAVTAFYTDINWYCYELIALEIDAPDYRQDQLKALVELLKREGKLRGCDYGSGIGTLGIYLNKNGINCDFADVSKTNLDFIAQRLAARGVVGPKRIHLLDEKLPPGRYDFITAFDVLEHVTDPLALIEEISDKLREGGLFVFNLLYHQEPNTPHILMDPNPIRKNIRGMGLRKVGAIGEFKVYQKVDRPKALNSLIRGADTLFWSFRERLAHRKANQSSSATD